MEEWTIYYNPKCGTCRNTLEILTKRGIKPRIVEYLKNPPTLAKLESIAKKLKGPVMQLVREKEDVFSEMKLAGKSDKELLAAIVKHPILLQRPVVVRGNRAVVCRPPETVQTLFE